MLHIRSCVGYELTEPGMKKMQFVCPFQDVTCYLHYLGFIIWCQMSETAVSAIRGTQNQVQMNFMFLKTNLRNIYLALRRSHPPG